ncbi:distal membrane-arm assembly complex protein 2 [Denticeps clupeoides]|uniref:distal membrane-arm assembly complex protein 2 n=1 Tax=Denticeps clupeoides TaxID=299321 RepID=UPI0010A517DA|nr:distal membrane-arm assembly complex protein 2 [Denticeps clupeoides]
MAAPCMTTWRCCRGTSQLVARRCWSSTRLPLSSRVVFWLSQRYYDVEQLIGWTSSFRNKVVRRKNFFYGYTQQHYGSNIASAYYILSLKGSFRFAGQTDWFRPNGRGRFSYDFMNYPDTLIEEVDMSGTAINCEGLDNLVKQNKLRCLTLRGCPEVDNWFLSRLHVFEDSLEELDISHCPSVSVGGLAALQNLRKLRALNVSSLPRLESPGLVQILLEEMLPRCHIIGSEYQQGLIPPPAQADTHAEQSSEQQRSQK